MRSTQGPDRDLSRKEFEPLKRPSVILFTAAALSLSSAQDCMRGRNLRLRHAIRNHNGTDSKHQPG